MNDQKKGIGYALTTAFLWGFLAIFLKIAVHKVDPQTIVWFRFTVAFVCLACWQLFKDPQSFRIISRPPRMLLYAAVALALNYLGFMLAVHYTTPSNAQLIAQTGPILFAFSGIFFFQERLRKLQIAGFLLAITGFYLFYSQEIKLMIGTEQRYNTGVLIGLGGAVAWVVYAILQKKLVVYYSGNTLNLFIFGFPDIDYLPFIKLSSLQGLSTGWWVLMIFLGLNTLLAYGSLAQALRLSQANKVSIIVLLNPIITFICMSFVGDFGLSYLKSESFTRYTLIGALVVLAGAILVIRKSPTRRLKHNQ